MNCKQVEEFLPLYVSGDLGEKRDGPVRAHLQACATCAGAANEYRQARELLAELAPPAFSESVYASVRQNVWRRIEAESAAPTMSEAIAGWFRPRLAFALASGLLLVVSGLAIYFIAHRDVVRQEAVLNPPALDRGKQAGTFSPEALITAPVAPGGGVKGPRQVYVRHGERQGARGRAPDRLDSVLANAPDALLSTAASPNLNSSTESESTVARDSGKIVRLEIQTRDPNIRIIWFAQ